MQRGTPFGSRIYSHHRWRHLALAPEILRIYTPYSPWSYTPRGYDWWNQPRGSKIDTSRIGNIADRDLEMETLPLPRDSFLDMAIGEKYNVLLPRLNVMFVALSLL